MKHSDPKQTATIRGLAGARGAEPGALLPLLHAIQDELGFIPEDAVAIGADVLNLSRAEVHGVVDETVYGRVTPERVDRVLSKP